jgi:hypothetical protein
MLLQVSCKTSSSRHRSIKHYLRSRF